ncbi:Detected protein of unknown function [Hibiscus syriacus]|uniref:Uncharacterized protein n=1 Tax=Hibiscus syriacus TaxID=106335 RepID=A0A6A2YCQ1_HIBSY|nr:Detected protein of unknown function [Hibiscus syriacus]
MDSDMISDMNSDLILDLDSDLILDLDFDMILDGLTGRDGVVWFWGIYTFSAYPAPSTSTVPEPYVTAPSAGYPMSKEELQKLVAFETKSKGDGFRKGLFEFESSFNIIIRVRVELDNFKLAVFESSRADFEIFRVRVELDNFKLASFQVELTLKVFEFESSSAILELDSARLLP